MKLGQRYTVNFWAKASSARSVSVALQQYDAPFIEVWKDAVALTSAWKQFSYIVDYPASAVTATPIFRFNLGQTTGTVWIDEIALCEDASQPAPVPAPVSPNCRVQNGDFESGSMSPWSLTKTGSAIAALTADTGASSVTSARVGITQAGTAAANIRLEQGSVSSTANAWNSLQFFARSSRGQTMQAVLRSATGQVYWSQNVRLPDPAQDAAFKHYFFVFQTPANDSGATLSFDMGANSGDVWIDAAHICNAPIKFQDEFSSNGVDAGKWDHCKPYSNNCADNVITGLLSWYKPGNARVSNGTLKLDVTRETNTICFGCGFSGGTKTYKTYDYASTYLQTNYHFTTQYGYVEMRSKMPSARGMWQVFWLLPYTTPQGQWSWPPEIDILEFHSQDNKISWHGIHYNTATEFNKSDVQQYQHPDLLGNSFHVYAINWTPDEIIWYVDGMETFRTRRYAVQVPMHLVLSVDVGGLAGPPPADADLGNATTEVDFVRVMDNSEAFAFDGSTTQPTPVPGATPTTGPSPTPGPTPTRGPTPTPNPNVKPKSYLPSLSGG